MKKLFLILALLFTTTFAFSVELKFLDIATEASTFKEVKKTLNTKKIKFKVDNAEPRNITAELQEYEGLKLINVTLYFNLQDKFTGFKLIFSSDNDSELIDSIGDKLIKEYEISPDMNEPYKTTQYAIYQVWSYSEDMKYHFTFGFNLPADGKLFIKVSRTNY